MSDIREQVDKLRGLADSKGLFLSANELRVRKALAEAADTIEALSAKVADGERAEDGWIYCGDGKNLPEEEKFYIVTYRFNDEKVLKCHELYYGIADDEIEAAWYIDDDCERLYKPFTVIAWKPLPSPYHEP